MFSKNAINLIRARYQHKNETVEGVFKRVAKALSIRDEKFERELYDLMVSGTFFPNSPCIRNAGRKKGTLSACFVLKIDDSITEIYHALTNMALVFQKGGGCGIDFSPLRPEGFSLSSGGESSGPVSFMKIFDANTEVIKAGGFRRGATLLALQHNHVDIEKFCQAKLKGDLTNANLSVIVNDDFMKKATKGRKADTVDLVYNDKSYGKLQASNLLDLIAYGSWIRGEPGILFYDRINKDNRLYPKTKITVTNPCLVGDTLVAVADGRNAISIRQLAEEGKDVPVYCQNKAGKIAIRMMRNPRLTGLNEEVYKVTFDDGNFVRVTGNHKFILSDNTTKKAIDLDIGDSISIMVKRMSKFETIVKGSNSNSSNYYWLKSTNSNKWIMDHRLICNFHYGPIGRKVVHHKNYDSLDNCLYNLELMTKSEHDELHKVCMLGDKNPMRRFPEKNIFNDPNFQKDMREKYHTGKKRSKETCKKISMIKKSQYENPELKDKVSKAIKCSWEKNRNIYMEGMHKRATKKLEECQSKTDLKCFLQDNEVMVEKICEGCNKIFHVPWRRREQGYHDLNCWNTHNPHSWKQGDKPWCFGLTKEDHPSIKRISEKMMGNTRGKKKDIFNHTVTSVEFDGYEDVYNGTVDEFHNFYIGHFETTIEGDKSYCYINNLQCGEVPLPPYAACVLGSINISKFVEGNNFNFDAFQRVVRAGSRALANINVINWYPLDETRKIMDDLQPQGLGIMGFSDTLIQLGIYYDSEECLNFIDELGKIYVEASNEVAPNAFYKRSIAPTGSLSILADCSSGIEPIFYRNYVRDVVAGSFVEGKDIYQSKYCKTAHEISPTWHVNVQAQWQKYVDAGVSKSINCSSDTTVDDIRKLYILAWRLGCKGITVFRDKSINGVYRPIKATCDGDACTL